MCRAFPNNSIGRASILRAYKKGDRRRVRWVDAVVIFMFSFDDMLRLFYGLRAYVFARFVFGWMLVEIFPDPSQMYNHASAWFVKSVKFARKFVMQ